MADAAIDGATLYYERRGAGEPLLLIMGMSGTHLSWGEPFLGALGEGLDLLTYDHRGIGNSGPQADAVTIAGLADDAAALLDAVGWESAHVLGVSMGGMVAQELALQQPERIRRLVLACTYPGGAGAQFTDPAVAQELVGAMLSGDQERALRASYAANLSAPYAAEPGNWETFHTMATALPVAIPAIMAQAQAVMGHDANDRLSSITAPTLVIHGTADRMLPMHNGEIIAERIPNARLELFEDVGHMLWWEQPERTAALVRSHMLDQ
jgi:pimeloyl-ACP methyl ester carboxylesterase